MVDETPETSDPCFSHLMIGGHIVDPQTVRDVTRFRKSERQRLYALRKAARLEDRRRASRVIADKLDRELGDVSGMSIGVYWPIRGEIDLRDWMASCHRRGARISLPVVVERDAPVAFHQWAPDCRMRIGVWKIPVPEVACVARPDVVIVPLLGVDRENYRLGNGGGYYDRTLATAGTKMRAIGVGQAFAMMDTIFPMPWDIAMDKVFLDKVPKGQASAEAD